MPNSNPDQRHELSQELRVSSGQCKCLLQSCNRFFAPSHPTQVFCSDECRLVAIDFERSGRRKEASRKANQKYR